MELHDLAMKVDSLVLTNDSLIKSNAVQTAEIKLIKDALLGSEYTKGKGMIEVQQDHADRIQALEAIRNVDHEKRLIKLEGKVSKAQIWVYSFCIVFGLVVGVNVAKFLTNLATHFFTK